MGAITKRDLRIFRGTYKECMAQETEDMKIYFAWDTHEIFVGNKYGAKISYGGSNSNSKLDIESYFNAFRTEIYEKVETFANNKVTELVTPKITEINNIIAVFKVEYETKLANLVGEIRKEVETQFSDTNSKVDSLQKSVISINSEIVTINNKIADIILEINSLKAVDTQLTKSINTLNENIISNKKDIDNITKRIDDEVAAVNAYILKVKSDIETSANEKLATKMDTNTANNLFATKTDLTSGLSAKLDEDKASKTYATITSVDLKLDKTTASETYATKDEIKDITSGPTNAIVYLTGDEIITLVNSLDGDISSFSPTFCTIPSTDSDETYSAGALYYYDNELEEITSATTGGAASGPTEIISNLSFTIKNYNTGEVVEEVNDAPLQVEVKASVDILDAIGGDVTLKYGKNSKVLNLQDDLNSLTTFDISRSTAGTYTISISAPAKTETKKYKYIVNGKTHTYSFYVPCFIGPDNNLKKLGRNYTGTITADKTVVENSGDELFIYTTGPISSITMNGFGYSFTLINSAFVKKVNNIDCTYYKYSLGKIYSPLDNIIITR